MVALLEIKDLHVSIDDKEIVKGLSLTINKGEIHTIMGLNGSGKSTLAAAVMGHPRYTITSGDILVNGASILPLKADQRARLGLFLAFQYPSSISGISVANFLRTVVVSKRKAAQKEGETLKPLSPKEFRANLNGSMKSLQMDESFAKRYVNEGFSGGEKKRLEILQMAMLKPQIAILDEPDSGLDIDAVRTVAEGVVAQKGENPDLGILIITHYQRILNYIKPNYVHVMLEGKIVREGGPELAQELEEKGYKWLTEEVVAG